MLDTVTSKRTYLLPELPQRQNVPLYGVINPHTEREIPLLFDHMDGFYGLFNVKGHDYCHVMLHASLEVEPHKDGYRIVTLFND